MPLPPAALKFFQETGRKGGLALSARQTPEEKKARMDKARAEKWRRYYARQAAEQGTKKSRS